MKNFDFEKIKKEIYISLDDTIEDKFEIFSEIINKEIELAKLFTSCFDIIKLNFDNFPEDFKTFVNKYSEIYKKLRDELTDYENGIGFGDWAIELRIKKLVNLNRDNIIKFLEVFKNIFIE